ncbi:MAG: hypothetical protein IFK92_02415 [Acidobacteria bacterium]|nr:hypothetical protein [Candidatus Sulfomarinibacter kjeldsenii]
MSSRWGRILVPVLVTLAILATALFIFSFFGGEEIAIGNLVLRAQKGTTYPLQAPRNVFPDAQFREPTEGQSQVPAARNVILFIGDGMGLGQVSAASDLLDFPGSTPAMTRGRQSGAQSVRGCARTRPRHRHRHDIRYR